VTPPGSFGRRARRVATAIFGASLAVLTVLTGLRGVSRYAVPDDAPVVALSVGADLVNDLGLHQASYQAALAARGARVVEVTPRDGRSASEVLDGVDALVLTGGGDVDPALYGGEPGSGFLVDPARDAFEAELIREAVARNLPVLAVCRGHQLMNVVFGGTLRDFKHEPALAKVHAIRPSSFAAHTVECTPGSLLAEVGQGERGVVNSFHAQGVDRVGAGLRATAISPDGVVEGLEVVGAQFAVSVQWHPDLTSFSSPSAERLFARFLDEARAYHGAANARRALP
jgi:putative glutamine amidotransferase